MPRSCQPTGVPGPAQRTRCQSAASRARWGALSRALASSPLRRVAGPARRGRVPASKHVVAGLVAGLRESAPDGRDPAESPGHKPPHSQLVPDKRVSLLLSRQSRASQRNDLCMDLWTIWMNVQINHCIAVDARGCGKVDNRTAQSCQRQAYAVHGVWRLLPVAWRRTAGSSCYSGRPPQLTAANPASKTWPNLSQASPRR
jgi:hypothetical protein